MTLQELQNIISNKEGQHVEFKQNVNSDLAKEIVAFANGSGGRIFIGVADNETIPGVTITNKIKSDIQSIAMGCDPAVTIHMEEVDGRVILIDIPEGKDKPYRSTNGFYVRVGPNSSKLSRDQLLEFIKTEGKVKFDELDCPDATFPDSINDFAIRRFMELAGITASLSSSELLINLGVMRAEGPVLNNTGVLFFTQNPSQYIAHSLITCVAYKGNTKVDIIDKKTFDLDIITNIDQGLEFIKRHLNLSYTIRGTQRTEGLEIPEVALREAIVNAVVHRNYFEKGAVVMVEIFDNRVEISNPGGLPKGFPVEEFGKRTLARNPLMASLLTRARYIEKLGTGVPRIRELMQKATLPAPVFTFNDFFTVVLRRFDPLLALREELKIPATRASRVLYILSILVEGSKLEPAKAAAHFKTTDRTIRNDLSALEEVKWISSQGSTLARTYELTDLGRKKAGRYLS